MDRYEWQAVRHADTRAARWPRLRTRGEDVWDWARYQRSSAGFHTLRESMVYEVEVGLRAWSVAR